MFYNSQFNGFETVDTRRCGENTGDLSTDGKTIRGSRGEAGGQSPVYVVSACANEAGMVMEQLRADKEANEIKEFWLAKDTLPEYN